MYRIALLFFVVSFLLFSCKQKETSFARQYLNEAKLTPQGFTIDPTKDTLLLSQSGIRISILQGTFSGTDKVHIDFKEALDFESILQAGLFTMSGDKVLSSAGMFYLNTKENLAINKPIDIEVPAKTALDGMQLYKGDITGGTINWEDPEPVTTLPAKMEGIDGKALFSNNCASCHRIDRHLTGPALAGVRERWNRGLPVASASTPVTTLATADSVSPPGETSYNHNPLYEYTINNQKYLQWSDYDGYACCISNKWYKLVMNVFPNLTYADLDALYKYVDDETERLGIDTKQFANGCDSCQYYKKEVEELETKREQLTKENGLSVTDIPDSTIPIIPPPPDDKPVVELLKKNADYYKITIIETGWYNIDILLRERNNVSESKLMVRLQGNYEKEFQVFLAIPAFKVFAEGGYLENSKEMGFKNTDGTLPLPQNAVAMVFAMGEEKGQFYFAKQWFNTKTNQTITLDIKAMSKQNFEIEISKIQQPGLDFSTDTSKNISSLKTIDEKLEKLNNKNLKDCNCGAAPPAAAAPANLKP